MEEAHRIAVEPVLQKLGVHMAVFGVIRVGFQANPNANNKARYALTGTIKKGDPEAPFLWKNTGLYTAEGADNAAVSNALVKLAKVLLDEATTIDVVSITLTRTDGPAEDVVPNDAVVRAVNQALDG
jgi:hypothetical protein